MSLSLRIIDEANVSAPMDADLRELLCAATPAAREIYSREGRGWHGIRPLFCSLVEIAGKPIAYVGIAERVIAVTAAFGPELLLRIAGPQNVSVHPQHRGRGHSIHAMDLAMTEARKRGFDAALLFCTPDLERLYSKTGFHRIAEPVTRTENARELPLPAHNIAMVLPLACGAFPKGPIHLRGNDW